MRRFSFLHAADLHLDSPFRGVTAAAPAIADRMRRSTFEAFANLVREGIDRHVDFVLIAGDVYDGADRSLRAQLRFRDGLSRLADAGIPSFVVHGNHDPLDGWSATIAWPPGVTIFGPEIRTVPVIVGGEVIATVSGTSYATKTEMRNLVRMFPRPEGQTFHIGLLHANVGHETGHEPYAPAELDDLAATGHGYWALGHVHQRNTLATIPTVVYPGNPQARHFKEQGARGCVHVVVDEARTISVSFVPLDVIRFVRVTLRVEGIATTDALDYALATSIEEAVEAAEGRSLVVAASIEGRSALHVELRAESASATLTERMRERFAGLDPFVWVETVAVDVRPEIDLDERIAGDDLVAEVLAIARELCSDTVAKEQLRSLALAELYNNPKTSHALEALKDDELDRVIERAAIECVDRLEGAS